MRRRLLARYHYECVRVTISLLRARDSYIAIEGSIIPPAAAPISVASFFTAMETAIFAFLHFFKHLYVREERGKEEKKSEDRRVSSFPFCKPAP